MKNPILLILLTLTLMGCGDGKKKSTLIGQYLIRKKSDHLFTPPPPTPLKREKYPWEELICGSHRRITKEFFRCKGNTLHPVVKKEVPGKAPLYYRDCAAERHGLILRDGKEFIYPCLIELLNFVQEKTEHAVIITSGHRCPKHNTYCDPSPTNSASKHLIGAEVEFYVEGMESSPEAIVNLLQEYYKQGAFADQKEYTTFQRYTKTTLNVSTPPWYNKEIFIKLYLPHEGRTIDNTHAYPYIGIQVRYDRDRATTVTYDPKQAQNYLRY